MAHDVFVCYSSEDKTIANAACAKLESAGIRCWMAPRDPIAGIPYGRQLVDAITAARVVLLIFSGNSNRSEHVLRELEVASDTGKIIVPFRIENVVPSGDLRYYITRVHWLDAMSPPMEARLNELVTLMQRLLEMPLTPAPALPVPAASKRTGYPVAAALFVIAATIAIVIGLYVARHPAPPAVHAIAKATPRPKHTAVHKTLSSPAPAQPPTPQIVYVPEPGAQAVPTVKPSPPKKSVPSKARTAPKPLTPATIAQSVAPKATPMTATRAPASLTYRLPSGNGVLVTRVNAASWRIGNNCCYETVGRTSVSGTVGTNLMSSNGRVWLFVPDLDASGTYAHQVCFSNAGPGRCDADRIFPITGAN